MASRKIAERISRKVLSSSSVAHARALDGSSYPIRAVGALTSKPYAFKTRSWELKSTESIDIFDGIGSNIRIDTRGSEIMRILPRLNEYVNEEWISDKSRFSYDGLKRQRLSTPMIRSSDGNLIPIQWDRVRNYLKQSILNLQTQYPSFDSHFVIGPYVDVETSLQLRNTVYQFFGPNSQIHVQEQSKLNADFKFSYQHNLDLIDLEACDALLLVGCDPRKEAPLLNSRLRKASLYNGLQAGLVGSYTDLTYPVDHLGNSFDVLMDIAAGKHEFSNVLANATNPAIIVSNRVLQRVDGQGIFKVVEDINKKCNVVKDDWDGLCVLHQGANTVGNLDLGFDDKYHGLRGINNGNWDNVKLLYLLGADDIDNINVTEDCLIVYQGHHGDRGASIANIILPGAAYTEKNATYVNTEGRVQASKLAFFPPGLAMNDAKILQDLLGYDEELQNHSNQFSSPDLNTLAPNLTRLNTVQKGGRILDDSESILPNGKIVTESTPFQPPIDNFFMTDAITRSSKTMAKCTQVRDTSNFPQV